MTPQVKTQTDQGQLAVARQPILDRSRNVMGYELLFRTDALGTRAPLDQASAQVISSSFLDIGLETLTDGRRAFVNVSRRLLLDGVMTVLPPKQVVLELASDVEADGDVIAACTELRRGGYAIAVDNFVLNEWTADLIPLADYLKVDFGTLGDPEARARLTAARGPNGPALIATGIETLDQFEAAASGGYEYFQGFFFGRPLITQSRGVPGQQVAHLRLLHALNNPNLSVHHLEELVKHDASLCYRILRTVNSAAFALQTPVQSIRQALIYIGRDTVRRWVSLWALAGLSERAHAELVVMATVRARFCEIVARGEEDGGAEGFLLGMCSLLDVILERPMAEVLKDLPLGAELQAALRGEQNERRALLDCAIAYERGEWPLADEKARLIGVSPTSLPKAYMDALRWMRDLQKGFSATS